MHHEIVEGSLLCSKETSGAASWTDIPLSGGEASAIATAGQSVPSKGRKVNTRWAGEKGIGKGLIVSIMLHAAIIAIAIVCSTGYVKKHEETITVFLADSEPTGERGPAGRAPAPVTTKPASPDMTRFSHNKRLEQAVPESTKPFAPETKKETPTSKASADLSSTLSVSSAAAPPAATSVGAAEGRGPQGGAGASATGAGSGGSNLGSSSGHGTAGDVDGEKKEYLARNFGYIRDLIVKNLKYPYAARRMGWKGSVTVAFVILENGTVEAVRVIKSSGYDLLDQSALKTVQTLRPFPKPPSRAEVIVPIAFRLE